MRINRKYKGGSGIDAVAHRRAINVAQTRAIQSGGESFLPPFTVTKGDTHTASAALNNQNTINQIGANGALDNVGRSVPAKGGSRRKSIKNKKKTDKSRKRRTRRNKKSRKSRSRK
jgi:hypothetical protein